MGLMESIRTAQASLGVIARQTALVSDNVARASDEGYARREAPAVTDVRGVRTARTRRAEASALDAAALAARSSEAAARAKADPLERARALFGGIDAETSPAALIASLKEGLQRFASEPSSVAAGTAAVESARSLVTGLNEAARGIAETRGIATRELERSANDLRELTERFGNANATVVALRRQGRDASDAEEARAGILREIADIVEVHVRERGHGDQVLLAGSRGGPVLFETVPRPIEFQLGPTSPDGFIVVDGTTLSKLSGGRIGGTLAYRDTVAPVVADQLDAIAEALIETFADRDPTGTQPPVAGVFTDPSVAPPVLATTDGLAGRIALNPAFDPNGGDPSALRDGLPGGPASGRNPTNAPGYAELLIERIEGIDTSRAFVPSLGLGATVSLATAASEQLGWLDGERSRAETARGSAQAAHERARTLRSNATGVNIDEEMARLLDLETSYRASTRVIAAADAMLAELLRMVDR